MEQNMRIASIAGQVQEGAIMHLSSHSMMAVREHHEIKQEIRHLTQPLRFWAIVTVLLILLWGVTWRTVHVTASREAQRVIDSR